MSRVVACGHCGAPHRLVHAQDRFVCDWCSGTNTVERDARPRELVVPQRPDPARARAAVEREIVRRGLEGARVETAAQRWLGLWQVLSEGGEEYVVSARRTASALERSLSLPAVAVLPREDASAWIEADLRPEVEAAEVVEAARASFRERDGLVETMRLIWLPVVDLRIHTAAGVIEGLHVGGADHVVLAPFPPGAERVPPRRDLLRAFALFCAVAVAVGVGISDPWLRAVGEVLWLLVGWTAWGRVGHSWSGATS